MINFRQIEKIKLKEEIIKLKAEVESLEVHLKCHGCKHSNFTWSKDPRKLATQSRKRHLQF